MFYGARRDAPGFAWLSILGRLKPGVPAARAEAALSSFLLNLKVRSAGRNPVYKLIPVEHGADFGIQDRLGDPARILMGAVVVVLLIACANLAGLLLARGSSRHREFAVRLSLGATRANLVRQILTESAVLAMLALLLSLAVSAWLTRLLLYFFYDPQSNVSLAVAMDPVVLAFTGALALATLLIFALLPAWYATRVQVNAGLKNQPSQLAGGGRLRRGLLAFEIALGLTLLFVAGVFTRTMRNLQTIELGFNPEQVVTLALRPAANGYTKAAAQDFFARLLDQSRVIAGVQSAALSSVGVLTGNMWAGPVTVPGYVPGDEQVNNNFNNVSPDYFRTLRIPLLAGRDFTPADRQGAPDVVIVNQQFVAHYWPGENVVGRHFRANGRDVEVVGVVRTAKYQRLKEPPQITIYFPLAQRWSGALTLDVRTTAHPDRTITGLLGVMRRLDPKLTVDSVATLVEQRDAGISRERLLAFLSTFLACLAAALVAIGLYGLIAYAVVRRTGEIGIRLALGARPGNIRWLFVRESLVVAVLGLAAGAPLAYLCSRLLKNLVFGVSPHDPLALIAGVLVLILVAAVAALLPSWRGSRLDPMRALRYE